MPASAVGTAAAMDGSGKLTARSMAAWEEDASASFAEAVVAGVEAARVGDGVGVAAAAAAVRSVVAIVISGADCSAAVAMLSTEAIGRRRRFLVIGG